MQTHARGMTFICKYSTKKDIYLQAVGLRPGVFGIKTEKLRNLVKIYLYMNRDKENITSLMIKDFVKIATRHGTTSSQLGNVMGKDKDIVKTGSISIRGLSYRGSLVSTYKIRDNWTPPPGVDRRYENCLKKAERKKKTMRKYACQRT